MFYLQSGPNSNGPKFLSHFNQMNLILFILILKMILILQFIGALINDSISTYFNSKMGLCLQIMKFGLFSGLNSKLILLAKMGLKSNH